MRSQGIAFAHGTRLTLCALLVFMLVACGGGLEAAGVVVKTAAVDDMFTVTVLDSETIESVDWYVDDELVETDTVAPFQLVVDTTAYSPGEHQVRVEVSVTILAKVSVVTRHVTFTAPEHGEDPGSPAQPGVDAEPTLLASYRIRHSTGAHYAGVTYQPRQYPVAPYQGWDVLTLPGGAYRTYTYPDWLTLELNRDATLIVLWNGSQPQSWLDGWERVGANAYRRAFRAGEVQLGAIGGLENHAYTVLLAEADGTPTPTPSVPSGLTVPETNQQCPSWVHDSYTTVGPDGGTYATWHPQIDPVYWCYLGHTHYSDPALLTEGGDTEFQPPYDYFADKGGHEESHMGFHGEVLEYTDASDGHVYRLWKNTHADTSAAHRVCAETHSHHLVLYDVAADEIVANIYHKPSFGPSRDAATFRNLAPEHCPQNANISTGFGARNIPSLTDTGYESWQIVYDPYPMLGISGGHAVAYIHPHKNCADYNCDTMARQNADEVNDRVWVITPDSDKGKGITFDASTAFDGGGVFYTDLWGTTQLSAGDPNAVRQYIKPGLNVTLVESHRFFTIDPWQYRFTNTGYAPFATPSLNLENGLIPH